MTINLNVIIKFYLASALGVGVDFSNFDVGTGAREWHSCWILGHSLRGGGTELVRFAPPAEQIVVQQRQVLRVEAVGRRRVVRAAVGRTQLQQPVGETAGAVQHVRIAGRLQEVQRLRRPESGFKICRSSKTWKEFCFNMDVARSLFYILHNYIYYNKKLQMRHSLT